MADFEVHELHTAEEIDVAFAKTFGMKSCQWAQDFDQDAVTDFLQALQGKRRVWDWTIHFRNWGSGNHPYEATVGSVNHWGGVKRGHTGYGFSASACHAIMKAAIHWDQRRRERQRNRRPDSRETVNLET